MGITWPASLSFGNLIRPRCAVTGPKPTQKLGRVPVNLCLCVI